MGSPSEVTAADVASNYTLNGYGDWFLPSKDELNQLYLQKDVVGGFADGNYWSSSDAPGGGMGTAWLQDFSDGSQDGTINRKGNANRVRAIRAF